MATPNKQRPTRYWSEQYKESCAKLSKQEIRLQEALYEISTGEEDLVSDLSQLQELEQQKNEFHEKIVESNQNCQILPIKNV